MTPIPPPQGLPPPTRHIRALRNTPRVLAFGVVGVVAIAVGYGLIFGMNHEGSGSAPAAENGDTGSATPDVLATAPSGNEITARLRFRGNATPTAFRSPGAGSQQDTTPAAASPSAPPPMLSPEDDMTEAAIAGRKAAWAAYYQQLQEGQQHRLDARRAAMASDIVPAETAPAPGAGETGGGQIGGEKQPQDFFSSHASNPATDYSPFTMTNPISPYELKATDIITAKLVSGMNSDSPGIIKAIVTKNVMDHATGMHIMVPQGSTLVGVYDTSIGYGQTRIVSAWQRIIYPAPCDQSLDLGAMPGSDQTGQAGFADITDDHLWKVFSSAILVSVFSAGAQLSQPAQSSSFSTYSPVQTAAGAVGQQTSQLGAEFARKGLSIPPTQQIRQGFPFAVMLTKDIAFAHGWQEGVCEENEVTPE